MPKGKRNPQNIYCHPLTNITFCPQQGEKKKKRFTAASTNFSWDHNRISQLSKHTAGWRCLFIFYNCLLSPPARGAMLSFVFRWLPGGRVQGQNPSNPGFRQVVISVVVFMCVRRRGEVSFMNPQSISVVFFFLCSDIEKRKGRNNW